MSARTLLFVALGAITTIGCSSGSTVAAPGEDASTTPDAIADVASDAPIGDGTLGETSDGGAGAIELVAIPAGSFDMGDHTGFVDPKHPSDELPIHTVTLSAFRIARSETTCAQYLPFLESLRAAGAIKVSAAGLISTTDGAPLGETSASAAPTCFTWDGAEFGIVAGRENHPASGVRWLAAVMFANWYGAQLGLAPCYTLPSGAVDWTKRCVRLPTEAEWEYAGRGGRTSPYANYSWGDSNDVNRFNRVGSTNPWAQGPAPQTTPVCFFDGSLRKKSDYGWPAAVDGYQTLDGRNGFGLCDVAGNVWEWVNDWYASAYYAASPAKDPPGPDHGDPMPDGNAYRNLRGGSFLNSTTYQGDHERVSNRDPAYFRGKYLTFDDPNGPWFHIGFRIVLQER
jgi:formylglycine-generating enzyme required for sulfatase activity